MNTTAFQIPDNLFVQQLFHANNNENGDFRIIGTLLGCKPSPRSGIAENIPR